LLKEHRILLVNPPGWQKESVNLGLSYLASTLKEAGYQTLILDINRYPISDQKLIERVIEYSACIIGISVKTATANTGGNIAELLAQHYPEAVFIAGGPHLTLCAESYMKDFPVFNYGVMGEGERHLVEIVDRITDSRPVTNINGLVYRLDNQIKINNWCPPDNLDKLPLPDLDSIEGFNWKEFRYPILTSRGCPFQCIYCCVNKLTGSLKWRSRSAENVVDELEIIKETHNITKFEVWDDNFTLNIQRAKEICTEIIRRDLNMDWYCHNGIRADRIDQELAVLMKKAGCTSIAFGIESGNPETFNSIKKGEPLSAVIDAVKIVQEVGIKAVGYFIIGLPGDTLERFIETVRFQHSLQLDHYTYGMLIPYPQTEVWDMVKKDGNLFCEITSTQHFSDDIVPISFDMPDFPKQDMIRAFYIAKYYHLFEAAQKIFNRRQVPTVIYLVTHNHIEQLPGMIIGSNPKAHHIIVGDIDKQALFQSKAFIQVPSEVHITFSNKLPGSKFKKNVIIVCQKTLLRKEKKLLFKNTTLMLFNPQLPLHLVMQVKKHIPDKEYLPEFILSIIGYIPCVGHLIRQYGKKSILKTLIYRIMRLRV